MKFKVLTELSRQLFTTARLAAISTLAVSQGDRPFVSGDGFWLTAETLAVEELYSTATRTGKKERTIHAVFFMRPRRVPFTIIDVFF